ncbi:MAG: bifunctional (p)ppGpp synthetase/guanosine-3',5'-bis(diphosphate) 3'-pyrophosphohydrolase [Actinomycetota bacterium]|nr:bifunctional (p)ppGpp synthetase/guanosine-3',5'-bis(diphosphate) 3'-pyrophosphohydrolase [Actinomycetota bacterium]
MTDAPVTRSRLAKITGWKSEQSELETLLKTLKKFHSKDNTELVSKAYEVAKRQHLGQKRLSGLDYITHPVAVATILAEIGMSSETLAAALLHDTVEDTGYSIQKLEEDFGPEVARLVDGVTKLDKVKYGEASTAETVRKMVVAMAKDIRVLLVKLADRLHNMRTLEFLPAAKQEQKARETLEIFAPLAHRLGMNAIKWELEDLSFAGLYPKMYDEIVHLVSQRAPQRDRDIAEVIEFVQKDLNGAKIKAELSGRPKHYYSVYQKMIVRGRDFNEIYDLVGIRILVEDVRDCYATLGTIHARWNPVPGRFKDYIAMPKFNLYKSLHTTVIGNNGRAIEFQIRTHDMHKEAEYGVASHWRYKERQSNDSKPADEMAWLRQLVDWQKETEDPDEFLDSLRYDLGQQDEIFVFTPAGDVVALPNGSTPVDFAYAVHTEVGNQCVGARVNGKLVSLDSKLSSGDNIEIFTTKSETAGPSQDWLNFAVSTRAKSKIKAWFLKERREEYLEKGKDEIAKLLRKQNLPLHRLMANQALVGIAHELRIKGIDELYSIVGEGKVSAQTVVSKLLQLHGGEEGATEDLAEATAPTRVRRSGASSNSPTVNVKGIDDVYTRLSRCCTPVPGDEIFGYVTRGEGVSVHRNDCTNATDLMKEKERIVETTWPESGSGIYMVNIQVEALDRNGLLSDVTRTLSEHHVNILSASVSTSRDRIALSRFVFEMADPKHLGSVLGAIKNIAGVYDVYRV